MRPIDSLIALIHKIFPDESCTKENAAEYVHRLALKDFSQSSEHLAPVVPPQENESRQYAPQRIAPREGGKPRGEPYATFQRMKQAGAHQEAYWSYFCDDAESFCKQAEFMKDFTDDYAQQVPLETYHATYAKMSDAQLRTYFTWRTKVRQGVVEETSLSYVFCYMFELLNNVGTQSPAKSMEGLLAIWAACRPFHAKLDHYLCIWLRDFYVLHHAQLTTDFSAYRRRFPVPEYQQQLELLAKAKACGWNDLRVIEASSSFKITNGQFYKSGDRRTIEACVCFVVKALAKHFKSAGVDFRSLFVESIREKNYVLFRGAVHPEVSLPPMALVLDEFEAMKLNSRGWRRESVSITHYRPVLGYLLKCVEAQLRRYFGYKRSLQVPNLSVVENGFLNSEPEKASWNHNPTLDRLKAWKGKAYEVISDDGFAAVIAKAIDDYFALEHLVVRNGVAKVVAPVELDLKKLKEIEKAYLETAEKLIVQEELPAQQAPAPKPAAAAPATGKAGKTGEMQATAATGATASTGATAATGETAATGTAGATTETPETGMAGMVGAVSGEGIALLRALLAGGPPPPNSELLVEAINEAALEAIADNLIDYAEGVPYVYDDYRDELELCLGGLG